MPPESTPPDPPAPVPVPPDLLAWAQQTFNVEEYRAGVREILATGGKQLEDFIGDIEAVVRQK